MKMAAGIMARNIFSNLSVKSKSPRQPWTEGPNDASSVQVAKSMLDDDILRWVPDQEHVSSNLYREYSKGGVGKGASISRFNMVEAGFLLQSEVQCFPVSRIMLPRKEGSCYLTRYASATFICSQTSNFSLHCNMPYFRKNPKSLFLSDLPRSACPLAEGT